MHPMLYEVPEGLPDPNTPDAPNEVRALEMLPQRIGPAGPDDPKPHGMLIERIYVRMRRGDGSCWWVAKPNEHLEKYLEEEFEHAAN